MITVLRETHETPPEIQRELTFTGGLNLYGEPHFRVVWGANYAEKYFLQPNRWYLERWLAPEKIWPGDPESWPPELGPFPSRGEYETCYALEINGEYMPLTPENVRVLVRMIELSRGVLAGERKAALRNREQRREREQERRDMDILDDAMGPFAGGTQIHAFVPSTFTG